MIISLVYLCGLISLYYYFGYPGLMVAAVFELGSISSNVGDIRKALKGDVE